MKATQYFFLLCLFLVSSCTLLDTEPTDFLSPVNYYETETEIEEALVGVYNVLGLGSLYGGVADLPIKFNMTDEMFHKNSAANGVQVFNFTANETRGVWLSLYRGIERANMLLESLDKAKMDEKRREIVRGEAKFLRAYFYFVLVQNFGDVPLRISSTHSVDDVYYPREEATVVYDFIYNEMVAADSLVKPISDYNHAGRISKSAVEGVLARVCLFMAGYPHYITEKYVDALYWAEKIIMSEKHELNEDYSKVYINLSQDKYDTKESIWEVELYTTGKTDIYNASGQWGYVIGINHTSSELGYCVGYYKVQEMLYKKYEKQDMRRDWAVAPFAYLNNTSYDKKYWNNNQLYDRFVGKYRREYEMVQDKAQAKTSINFPLLRYADVLLMAAEAENEIHGPTTKALSYINEVRRRAYGSGKSIESISLTNGGNGYTSVPDVVIAENNARHQEGLRPTQAKAIIADGAVISVEIENYGSLYTQAPLISIIGGGGQGATAISTLSSLTKADFLTQQYTDKDALRKAIQDERARELCFEGMRRNDLIRWGIFIDTMKDMANFIAATAPTNYKFASRAAENVSTRNLLFPIPESEITLNKLLTQNPGW